MNLKSWWSKANRDNRKAVSLKAGTTEQYLSVMASRGQAVGEGLAFKLAEASQSITPDQVMTMEALRPDSYCKYEQLFSGKEAAA